MRVLFDYHELWDVVESGVSALGDNVTEAQREAHRDQKKKDNKALYLIHQGMNEEKFEHIEGATTASEAWTILSTNYKGCTNHMCGKKELFADLDDSFHTKVKFGDGRFVLVTGKGRILITLKNGDHKYIYDVFYVPDMKSNLLSMGQLAEKGYVMHIVENKLSIFDKKR
ncbi:uncharacterized protein [Phaseolus vulgaris]|uniref:uncharacterized protein n=1 Tax=Phaseolus vulgaris TaxID=3885 RepID=UPI0035CBD110